MKKEQKKIHVLEKNELKDYILLGQASGVNLNHCIAIGASHKKDFMDRVAGYRIIEKDKTAELIRKVTGKEYVTVEFYEPKDLSKFTEKNKIPEGFYKCKVCGEYTGRTKKKNLNWEDSFLREENEKSEEYISVSCFCEGILCSECKKNKIHRPITNSYCEDSNTIEHWPWFAGMRFCDECSQKKSQNQ